MIKKIKSLLFTNRTSRQTIAKNTFWLTVSNFGGRILRAIIIVYGARILGAAGWGVFSYAISLIGFITIFVDLGMSGVLTRELAKSSDERYKNKIIASSFVLKLILALAGVGVVVIAAPHFATIKEAVPILPIVAFVLLFDTIREFTSALARAKEKMEVEAGLFILTNVAIIIFGFIFLKLSPTVKSFSYAYAVGTGVGMLTALYALKVNIWGSFLDFSVKLLRPLFSAAWPVAISTLLSGLMINTDMIIIGMFLQPEQVGYYSAAERLSQFIQIIPAIIAVSVFPVFSRLASTDKEKMSAMLEKIISLNFFIAFPIALGGMILSGQLIGLIFGVPYLPATPSFQVLLLVLTINFSAPILTNAIFAYNKTRILLASAIITGVMNVLLDLILIPRFGIFGSAWATFIALLSNNIFLWYEMKRINHFKVFPHLKKIALASAIMAVGTLAMFASGINLFVNVLVSIAIYVGALYLFREPIVDELKFVLKPFGAQKSN